MTYVWAAYSITWLAIFAYTLVLGRRQRRLARDVRALERALEPEAKGGRG